LDIIYSLYALHLPRTLFSSRNSYAEPAFLRSVGLMITLWLLLKHHISTQNEGKDFLATSILQNFLRGWGHAGGRIGSMLSKGLGMFSSAIVANLLGYMGACSPREILKFRRLELLFSAFFQSVFGPKVHSNLRLFLPFLCLTTVL